MASVVISKNSIWTWREGLQFTSGSILLGQTVSQIWHGGANFTVNIAQGATINSAYITLTAYVAGSGTLLSKIYANDVDSASTPTQVSEADAILTALTTAVEDYDTSESWVQDGTYNSVDITDIIQEIVDRAGWSGGNSLTIIIKDDGTGNENERIADDCTLTIDYTNPPLALDSITVVPSSSTLKGLSSTKQLVVLGNWNDGSTTNLTAASEGTTYVSSDPTKATISSAGLVSAVAAGTSTITATNSGKTGTCSITVVAPTSLTCYPSSKTMRGANVTQQLSVKATFADNSIVYVTSSSKGTAYISSDEDVATVSNDGLVTSVAAGEATIAALNSSLTAECVVTVLAGTQTYATDSDLRIVYKNIHYFVDDDDTWQYLTKAYDWVRDTIRPKITPPDPATDSVSESLVLAEAHYAVYLILKANGESQSANVRALDFYQEAWRLLIHILDNTEFSSETNRGGPQSNSEDMQPKITRGIYDINGVYKGDKMGISDEKRGTLDDW